MSQVQPETYDVVVVGSGAGALTAAVVAAQGGLKVLVVEKSHWVGGTSALSGGIAWAPDNDRMREAGLEDSPERAMRYLTNLIGNHARPEMLRAYVENAREMAHHMEASTELEFICGGYPDYRSELDGGVDLGRSVGQREYDGRKLGSAFSWVRPPLPAMSVMGSMMVDKVDMGHLIGFDRSWRSFVWSARLVAKHAWDVLRYGRGVRFLWGNALIARLLRSGLDAGLEVWRQAPAVELTREGGRVTGVVVERAGERTTVVARRGVVLGSGGFAHDEELKAQLVPHPAQHHTFMVDTNTGDGLKMALAVGARLGSGNWQNVLGTQAMFLRDKNGRILESFLFGRRDRPKPGFVLVNKAGRRFINDADDYNYVTHAMNNTPGAIPSFVVTDHRGLRRFGLGLVRPGPAWTQRLSKYQRGGHVITADTIEGLAAKLDVDAEGLTDTIARNNRYAQTGKDLDFNKGERRYDTWQGDPAQRPNPNLGPIDKAPFHAIVCWPANLGTACGVLTDAKARALDGDDKPIPGLYAVGSDLHSAFSGHYPGGGGSIGPSMTFGYLAARDLIDAK